VSGQGAPSAVTRLADDLVRSDASLNHELASWISSSRRFRAFAEAHRDKIRKKVRGATDPDALLDVRAELRVAHLLLADRRIGLAFEAYGSGRAGPDFSLTFRDAPSLNLEVTRPRSAAIVGPLLTKLRQLPTSRPNAVVLALDRASAEVDVATTVRRLRERADGMDEAFFASRGLDGARAFHQRLLRLGGVIAWRDGAGTDVWLNRSARIPLPEAATRAVVACLGGP